VPKREELASLRDGLLKLTMAWLVHVWFGSAGHWTQLVLLEVFTVLVKLGMEGVHMGVKLRCRFVSCVRECLVDVLASRAQATIPAFGLSLLMSP
jgi:hypothetical protein